MQAMFNRELHKNMDRNAYIWMQPGTLSSDKYQEKM